VAQLIFLVWYFRLGCRCSKCYGGKELPCCRPDCETLPATLLGNTSSPESVIATMIAQSATSHYSEASRSKDSQTTKNARESPKGRQKLQSYSTRGALRSSSLSVPIVYGDGGDDSRDSRKSGIVCAVPRAHQAEQASAWCFKPSLRRVQPQNFRRGQRSPIHLNLAQQAVE
jgi:hypothetical protein